jgi:hypothetical protein
MVRFSTIETKTILTTAILLSLTEGTSNAINLHWTRPNTDILRLGTSIPLLWLGTLTHRFVGIVDRGFLLIPWIIRRILPIVGILATLIQQVVPLDRLLDKSIEIFPYLDGGELLQRLNMHGRFTEEATKQVVRVILVCPA